MGDVEGKNFFLLMPSCLDLSRERVGKGLTARGADIVDIATFIRAVKTDRDNEVVAAEMGRGSASVDI